MLVFEYFESAWVLESSSLFFVFGFFAFSGDGSLCLFVTLEVGSGNTRLYLCCFFLFLIRSLSVLICYIELCKVF